MRVLELEFGGYRSIRQLHLHLEQATVIVGANGCGKSNLYRALLLLSAAARGNLAHALLREGGMPSVVWAGRRKKGPVQVRLRVVLDGLDYVLVLGLPSSGSPHCEPSLFMLDPLVKEETIAVTVGKRRVTLLERRNRSALARDQEGYQAAYPIELEESESVLSQLNEPHRYPEMAVLRHELSSWRFYHHFATSEGSPLREPRVAVRTPVLADDGRDLAAALRTIVEVGAAEELAELVELSFPGSSLRVSASQAGALELSMQMPGIERPFSANELSDGTLRYLCLLAALLSPRPPAFLVLNEPETSIHPDLIGPLAALITRACRSSQVLVTTHSAALAKGIEEGTGIERVQLEKVAGETRAVDSQSSPGEPGRGRRGPIRKM